MSQAWHGEEEAKRQGNNPLYQGRKSIINAVDGVLGTTACRFFAPRLASSIPMPAHATMRQTKAPPEAPGYDVSYGYPHSTFHSFRPADSDYTSAHHGSPPTTHAYP
ncbi:hypothetical protein [Salmonella enterica]|uniref:hypothetical protein n=1 Tax=Salmonella enterica TaxID=28901 RepID=UPI00398C5CD4